MGAERTDDIDTTAALIGAESRVDRYNSSTYGS
jgi:hypothetical protein